MSTKTTFKRIALVAVAALGFGTLSVVPSSAVPQVDTLTASALTATAVPGAEAKVTLSQTYLSTGTGDTVTATVSIQSMPAANTVLPVLASVTTNDKGSPVKSISGLTASTGSVAASTAVRGDYTLSLTTLTVGTYVFKVTPQTGSAATALTLTYTIADTATAPTAASSRVYMRTGALTANANGTANDQSSPALLLDGNNYEQVASVNAGGTVTYSAATLMTALGAHIATQDANTSNLTSVSVAGGASTNGNVVATFGLILGNGDTITASTISGGVQEAFGTYGPSASYYFNAAGYPVTATVTGPGFITYQGVVKGKSFTEATTEANYLQKSFSLTSDGTLGVSTITFTAGGVTLATRTVTFTGDVASYTVAAGTTFGGSSYQVGANAGAYLVTQLDAAKNPVAGGTIYAYSGTAATATILASATPSSKGVATFDLTGVAAGTSLITFGNKSTLATSTITATATAAVTGSVATTVTLTLDKAEYAPGEKMTLTVTALDANGKPVADGSRAVIELPTSTVAIGGTPTATTTLKGGVATQTLYAPATSGSFTISAKEGAATASTTKATITVTAGVINEALDAASEAIDAANAATDAANAAAEAADAATAAAQDAADAVAALSTSVSAMITALKKQITALTNLVIKIQKKVKA